MRHTLEVIFRRPLQVVLLLLLPLIVSLAIAFLQPRMYKDTASLWVNHHYAVVGTSSSETDISVPPAQTHATALAELLQTRTFALDVAKRTGLAAQLSSSTRADPELRDDALVKEIAKVQVEAVSYHLFTVAYQNKDPQIAQQVVQGVIQEYGTQSNTLSQAEADRLLAIYQGELQSAQKDEAASLAKATQYVHDNPTADLRTDPQYLQLQADTDQARKRESDAQTQIDQINYALSAQGAGAEGLFQVIDAPELRKHPESLTKTLAIFGGVGLVVGLMISAAYVLLLVRRDTTLSQPQDVQRITAHAVLMHVPVLQPATGLLAEPDVNRGGSAARRADRNGSHNGNHTKSVFQEQD